MKRYRVLAYTFDTRSNILNMEISENWTPEVRNTWRRNKDLVRESLVRELGEENADDKLRNVTELGALPFSFLAFHNTFLRQSRTAFCVGAYYPALTSACALGERILNHLVIKLRDDFKHTAEYKSVYRKKSFDDWNKPIDALAAWNVLLPDVSETFNSLREQRNDSLHFRPDVDDNARELALKAIRTLSRIIEAQFGMASDSP